MRFTPFAQALAALACVGLLATGPARAQDKPAELKIGIIAVAAIVLTAMIIVAVGGAAGFSWEQYELKTRFGNVQGLKTGAVVRVLPEEDRTRTLLPAIGDAVFEHVAAGRHVVEVRRKDASPAWTTEVEVLPGRTTTVDVPPR